MSGSPTQSPTRPGAAGRQVMLNDALIILALTLINGLFAGTEIAVLSLRKTRLSELIEQKARGAQAVQWLRNQPERFLATVQIGITVVSTTAAAFGGEQIAGSFGAWLASRLPALGPHASRLGLLLVISAISFSQIVLGELVPKSLALRSAERYALAVGPLLRLISSLAKPLVWTLTRASNLVLRVFGDKTSFTEARLSPDELRELVEEAAQVGSLDAKTGEIASRAIDFRELTVLDVMVPRVDIVALDRAATRDDILRTLSQRRLTRLPVYEGTPENITGYVILKEMVAPAIEGRLDLGALVRPVRFVPASMKAADLLRDMQGKRLPLVMVVDENGGLVGLVTVEDLLEELVGDIFSENDAQVAPFAPEPDGSIFLPGATPIRKLNRQLGLELPEPDGVVTVAGLCLDAASTIPAQGALLTLADGSRVEIVDASVRRVRRVRLWPPAQAPER